MHRTIRKTKPFQIVVIALAIAVAAPLIFTPDSALARRGGKGGDGDRFYGIIQSMPADGLQGVWVIGGRKITTDPSTEFDQVEGPLTVGACAKVDFRNGRVHEIDSEPPHDCK